MKNKFIRVRSTRDIVISAALLILGVALVVLTNIEAANICGYLLVLTGLVLLPVLKTAYRDVEKNALYSKKDIFFLREMKDSIIKALESSPEKIDMSQAGKGQVLLLRVYYSKSAARAYMQLSEYVPHEYKPCTEVCVFDISQVEGLLK